MGCHFLRISTSFPKLSFCLIPFRRYSRFPISQPSFLDGSLSDFRPSRYGSGEEGDQSSARKLTERTYTVV
jgi:hypothetical protein